MDKDCPICGKRADFKNIFTVSDYKGKDAYAILECSSCKVKKTEPAPEDLTLNNAYDEKVIPRNHWLKSFLVRQEIRRIVKLTNSKVFLDIGPGDGEFSENLSACGYSVVAADAWTQRPFYIREKTEIPYIHFDYDAVEAEDPSMLNGRTVILRHVLEHIRDPRIFLEKLIHHKAKFFFIAVPNGASFERKIFKQYDSTWCIPCHLWHFDVFSLKCLFKQLGLSVVSFGYETTPTVGWHIYHYMRSKKYPKFLKNIYNCGIIPLAVSLMFNIFFRNNVLWALVKVEE